MKSRVEVLDRSIVADVLDAPSIRADFARRALAEAKDQNRQVLGKEPDHVSFVDGVVSEVFSSVRPDGRIIFEFEIGVGVVQWIHAALLDASPVKTGRYKASHVIYADGVEVTDPMAAEGAEEVVILPLVPYARKIEGRGARRPQSRSAPKGVYQVVSTMAARRFGNLARIRFTYQSPIGGASELAQWAGRNAGRRDGANAQRRQMQKNLRQPAILIRFR